MYSFNEFPVISTAFSMEIAKSVFIFINQSYFNMRRIACLFVCTLLSIAIIFVSCKREYSFEKGSRVNQPPVARAGIDTTIILPSDSMILDGSASSDRDGVISTYSWKKISGSDTFTISNVASVRTMVNKLVYAVYDFELMVTDDGGLSAKDTIRITVLKPSQQNRPPVADAGSNQTIVLPANSALLDGGRSLDPDNNITSYAWRKLSGPSSYNISSAVSAQAQVSGLTEGIYYFELTVTDSGGLFSKDTLMVSVITNSLSGKEFTFANSVWRANYFYGIPSLNLYAATPVRPDLFVNPGDLPEYTFPGKVYLKYDTASNWILAKDRSKYVPDLSLQHLYDCYGGILYVHRSNYDSQFVGRAVSIKVKFD